MTVGFRNITKCQTKSKISASDTTIMLENTADYVPFISSPGDYVYAVLRDQQNKEIVKIDVSASSIYGLSVERGQENTSAKSWNRGTLFYQDLTAESLDILRQKEVFRTFTYNPNGIVAPAYANEKIYQTGATACEKRWWKSINATHLVWVLIAGTICDNEIWYPPEDWDWDVPPDWEWPVVVYQVAMPLMIPDGGVYTENQSVEISCATSGATIYYTTDGTEPDDNSTEYIGPVTISDVFTTLKAIAYRADTVTSDIATEEYILPPKFDVVDGQAVTVIGLQANGEMWGWGNDKLCLTQVSDRIQWLPVQVEDLATWVDMAVGGQCVFGLKNDGTLWARGRNYHGSLGLGDTIDRSVFTQVGASTDWAKVFAYSTNTFAIKTNGTLWVWGRNQYSSLGLGDTDERHSPVQLGALTNYSSVAGNSSNTIVVKTDGTMWGWGRNYSANLGVGDKNSRTTPVQVGVATNWSEASLGAATFGSSLGLKTNGTLWAWGHQYYGSCGDGVSGVDTWVLTPTQIGAVTTWKAIKINTIQSCLATRTDGTLWGWGRNWKSVLGFGDDTLRSTPAQVDGATNWDRPVTSSTSDTMHVLKTDKTIYASGYYSAGALGLGETGNSVNIFTQIREIEL